MTGRVKFFNEAKGFGFIENDEKGQPDCFLHHTEIMSEERYKTLAENDEVSFEVEEGEKGPRAKRVQKI